MARKKFNLTKKEMEDLYIRQKLSIPKIAIKTNFGYSTIRRYLHRFNITIRRSGPARNIPLKLEGELLETIEGHLLGDGHIPRSKSNHYFTLKSKHYNYTKHVTETLTHLGPSKIHKVISKNEKFKKGFAITYVFETKCLISPEFYKKWYTNGIKKIPEDLILTPSVMLYWYLDDGSLSSDDGRIVFSTQSFTEPNLKETVLPQLRQILDDKKGDIKIHRFKSAKYMPKIYMPRKYTKRFLEYIGKCPIKEFEYKWHIKPYKLKGCKYL